MRYGSCATNQGGKIAGGAGPCSLQNLVSYYFLFKILSSNFFLNQLFNCLPEL
jgi:hypothetical protein